MQQAPPALLIVGAILAQQAHAEQGRVDLLALA